MKPDPVEPANNGISLSFFCGDILEFPADGLLASGNIHLNMSGGVNGALLLKYGHHLQVELHEHLKSRSLRYVDPGFVYLFKSHIPNYRAVTYSVGIDAWYDSSSELVQNTLEKSILLLASQSCSTIAICALGTGFGHLSAHDFGIGLRGAVMSLQKEHQGLQITLVDRNEDHLKAIRISYLSA